MYRWASRWLIAVMLAPSIGPLAMPCAASPVETHLSSKNVVTDSSQPMMQCHRAMAGMSDMQTGDQSPSASSGSRTVRGLAISNGGNCCESHCCCGAMTSEWAQPVVKVFPFVRPLIEPANIVEKITSVSVDRSGPDSARAPPRG